MPQTLLPVVEPDRATPLTSYVRVNTAVDVALLYLALTGAMVSTDDVQRFAATESYEYRSAGDAFKKNALLLTLKRHFEAQYEVFKSARYIVITRSFTLEPYDPTSVTFSLDASLGANFSWLLDGRLAYSVGTTNYDLLLSNSQAFGRLKPASESAAQELESRQGAQREGHGDLFLFVRDVDIGKHQIRTDIIKVRIVGLDDRIVNESAIL